jgi:hypothetical protein
MNGIPEKARFEVEESPIYKALVAELNEQNIFDSKNNYIVRDRAMGSGPIIKLVEDGFVWNGVNPNGRVYGCEMHKMDVQYAIHKYNLQGIYIHTGDYMIEPRFDSISFLPSDRNFKLCEVGNYPYNDGSVNNNVIWPKFIADVRASDTDFVGVVVQASFLSQQFKGMAKKVKQDLIALGCYKIVINEYSDFDETKAKVKTCIVFCRKGYVGRVTYVERSTGRTVQKSLELPFDMIFDTNHIQFLDALDQSRTLSFARFPQYGKWCKDTPENKKLWAIGSYYKTEGFDKNPLKQFVKIAPLSGAERNYYCVFGSAKTEAEIDRVLEQVKSFWFNDAVQSALLLTRYQISLDKTQYAKIPKTIIDHIFSEDELFKIWGIPENAKQAAKELVKNCDYKKKVAIEESNAENN